MRTARQLENVIDRKPTRYRLNQYGSQFDNKDALDTHQKKEELNRREEVMKEATADGGSGVSAKLGDELKLADTLKQHQSFIQERLTEANKQKE